MRYLLNIGNTRAAVASGAPGGSDFAVEYFPTEEIVSCWTPCTEDDWRATAASVVPWVRRALEERFPGRIHFISPADYPEIDCSGYEISRLGADRLANLAGAHRLCPDCAIMVIDCGTALNSVCVSAGGVFLGGVILPGRETALRALARNTAQLPEFAVTAPHEFNPLGGNPEDGIRNGVDIGILGAAEKIIRATRSLDAMAKCKVWFTGGDAPFFVKYLPLELGAELAPLPLTLYGVSLAAQK